MKPNYKIAALLTVKKAGIIDHPAIHVGNNQVLDNSPGRGSVGYRDIDDFSGGKEITEIPYQSEYSPEEIIQRAKGKIGSPYKLFSQNCEHFTNFVLFNRPASKQAVIGGLILLTGAIYVMSKKG